MYKDIFKSYLNGLKTIYIYIYIYEYKANERKGNFRQQTGK